MYYTGAFYEYMLLYTKTTLLLILYLLLPGVLSEGFPQPAFLMSWRRRIGKEEESLFFGACEDVGLDVNHIGSRVYCIKLRETTHNK